MNKLKTRRIALPSGQEITYTLERKAVKNVNLRRRTNGTLYASAAPRVPVQRIDDFVRSHADRLLAPGKRMPLPDASVPGDPLAYLAALTAHYLPALAAYGVTMPQIRLRRMTSRWGSCIPGKNAITFSTYLLRAPQSCIEYVVVHELCHLVHANHSPAFHALVRAILPNADARRALLKQYALPKED